MLLCTCLALNPHVTSTLSCVIIVSTNHVYRSYIQAIAMVILKFSLSYYCDSKLL